MTLKPINIIFKICVFTLTFFNFFTYSHSNILDLNKDSKNISNYFSGSVAFNNFDYITSKQYFDKFNKSEKDNQKLSSSFLKSLINLQKFNEAITYSKNLESKNLSNFESLLFLGLKEFKNKNYIKAKFYFNELKPNFENQLVFAPLKLSLINWSEIMISNKVSDIKLLQSMPNNFGSFKSIQEVFAYCYFDNLDVDTKFEKIIKNEGDKFYRYNFFYANYLIEKNRKKEAASILESSAKKYPRNLLINQLRENLEKNNKSKNKFSCQNPEDILAEIFYAFANALSVQKRFELSNLYINFSKYLNSNFKSYDALLADFEVIFDPARGGASSKLALASLPVMSHFNKLGDGSFISESLDNGAGANNPNRYMFGKSEGAFGHKVLKVDTIHGDMTMVKEPLFRANYSGYLCLVDLDHVAYRPLVGNGYNRDTSITTNVQQADEDLRKDLILTEAGLEVSLPETHALLHLEDA